MGNVKDIDVADINPKHFCVETETAKQHILAGPLNDMQKLKHVFDLSKDNLKKYDPQLYYAILGVLHSAKCMKCAGMGMIPSDYFSTTSESKEDK